MICVGTEVGTSLSALVMADGHEDVWAAVGYHPAHISETHHDDDELGSTQVQPFHQETFREIIRRSPKVVAIGECGLDVHGLPSEANRETELHNQLELFRAHLDLAREFSLPVIIHCRDLHNEVLAVLEEYRAAGQPVRGVAHCFTGTVAEAQRYLALGFYVSFAGTITYPPRKAEKERGETAADVVQAIPLEQLLVETDSPYLAPVPHRGERNEPDYVRFTVARVAEIKNLAVEEVEQATKENTIRLFGLK